MSENASKPARGFEFPPHANAGPLARLMARLRKMTPDELFQTLVDAGIYTPDGQLTEHYRDGGSGKK